ncbi:redoxin domain-containing protein [Hoyosella sp. YIM 151337]|uniref:redoxin domain-containing protein n=1 Tax=Hoyosella sp. YIM 151337 TaxID=2992742 RepID=UPI0022369442|nr:redoxin domain-containing protein [Hoyosella sp. YIM 151337]MCW4355861.1 redoxin domain-containing protein [Hoyosella sp. YIM 151337]
MKHSDDTTATEDSVAVIPSALEFTAETLNGETVHGTGYAGHAAVFWFWAPWCAVCHREAPNLADAAASYGDSVEFLGIAAQDSPDAMRGFVDQYGVSDFPHLNDADAAVWAKFGVTQQPAFAFLSESGELEVVRGTLSPDELDIRISELSG